MHMYFNNNNNKLKLLLKYGSFPGVKWPGRGANPHPHLQCRDLKKGSAKPLPTLRASVAYKGETFCFLQNRPFQE